MPPTPRIVSASWRKEPFKRSSLVGLVQLALFHVASALHTLINPTAPCSSCLYCYAQQSCRTLIPLLGAHILATLLQMLACGIMASRHCQETHLLRSTTRISWQMRQSQAPPPMLFLHTFPLHLSTSLQTFSSNLQTRVYRLRLTLQSLSLTLAFLSSHLHHPTSSLHLLLLITP